MAEILATAEHKLHSPALFAAKLTLSVGAAATEPEARRALMRIAAALGQFAVPAGAEFRIGRVRRSNQLRRKEAAFLTAEELARLYYRGDGIVGFDIVGHKDIVTMLGSFDLGLNNDIGPHLSISGGYRVVVASGVALADNQIPHVLAAANEFADVKTNGDLIAHGAFGGLSFHWSIDPRSRDEDVSGGTPAGQSAPPRNERPGSRRQRPSRRLSRRSGPPPRGP